MITVVVEYQICFDMLHLYLGRDSLQNNAPQVFRITDCNMNEEVIFPSYMIDVPHLTKVKDMVGEAENGMGIMFAETNGYHGQQADSQVLGLDVGMEALEDTDLLQATGAFERG